MKNGKVNIIGGWAIYKDNVVHCEDGPAKHISDKFVGGNESRKEWWINGKPHRDDGPAVVHKKGNRIVLEEWWINGFELTEEQFKQWQEKIALNQWLQSSLAPSPTTKRGKI